MGISGVLVVLVMLQTYYRRNTKHYYDVGTMVRSDFAPLEGQLHSRCKALSRGLRVYAAAFNSVL
jgi:hypothetical protein